MELLRMYSRSYSCKIKILRCFYMDGRCIKVKNVILPGACCMCHNIYCIVLLFGSELDVIFKWDCEIKDFIIK